ncbi:Uncharacterized protein PBTT_04993 [Plasmodiophora brassicae]
MTAPTDQHRRRYNQGRATRILRDVQLIDHPFPKVVASQAARGLRALRLLSILSAQTSRVTLLAVLTYAMLLCSGYVWQSSAPSRTKMNETFTVVNWQVVETCLILTLSLWSLHGLCVWIHRGSDLRKLAAIPSVLLLIPIVMVVILVEEHRWSRVVDKTWPTFADILLELALNARKMLFGKAHEQYWTTLGTFEHARQRRTCSQMYDTQPYTLASQQHRCP